MDESDEGELINLEQSIGDAKVHYRSARDHLRLVVAELQGEGDAGGKLLSVLEEMGGDYLADRLRDDPGMFGFSDPSLVAAHQDRLIEVATTAHEMDTDLCRYISARETILCAEDSTRQRRYVFEGREAVLDIAHKTLRYVDDDSSEALVIERVEPTGRPDLSLEAMQQRDGPSRRRQRDR